MTATTPAADPAATAIQPPQALLPTLPGGTVVAFPLQTEAWIKMQSVIPTAMSFPLTQNDFTTSYGAFPDEAAVTNALKTLGAINTTAHTYGDPLALIASFAAFQQAAAPPATIYAHAVWLAAQVQLGAQNIASFLTEGLAEIGTETDPAKRLADLTELLTDEVKPPADAITGHIGDFQTVVSDYYTKLNTELTNLQDYLTGSANILAEATTIAGNDATQIGTLNDQITSLNKEYTGFVIGASLSPLFLFLGPPGVFLAVADAAAFGVEATKVKNALDNAKALLRDDEQDQAQKLALVAVLDGFNKATQDVETDGTAFLTAIGTMAQGWTSFSTQIGSLLQNLTVADVAKWDDFMQRLNFTHARDGWNIVASKAEEFYDKGFVVFSTPPSS